MAVLLPPATAAANGTAGMASPHSAASSDASVDMEGALGIQILVGMLTMASTPLYSLVARKEYLPPLALFLVSLGALQLTLAYSMAGLSAAAVLMGGAYGATNAYSTSSLWEYFYGGAESSRIKHLSIAITTAASGLAILEFGASRAWAVARLAAACVERCRAGPCTQIRAPSPGQTGRGKLTRATNLT